MTATSLMLRQPGGANALDFDGVENTVDLGFSFERFVPPLSLVGIRASSRVSRVSILQAQDLTPLGIKATSRVGGLTVLAETAFAPVGLVASSDVGTMSIAQTHKLFPAAIKASTKTGDASVTWPSPTVDGTGNGSVTLSAGTNTPSAPSAPTIDAVGDGSVTLNAA
jgi:hypothetical protein